MLRRRLAILLLFLLTASPALAHALAPLAPDSTVVVAAFADDGGAPAGLRDAWAALDWPSAVDTLGRLAMALGDDVADLVGGGLVDELMMELAAECPAVADTLSGADPMGWWSEGLLAVSLTAFAPTPHVVALARVTDPAAADLQAALVACFGGTRLDQDGIAIEVLFDGSEMPLIVTRIDDLFVLGTEPNLVRGVVRRSLGSGEASLATTALGAALARLTPGGLSIGLDLAALGEVAGALAGAVPPEAADLLNRAIATLETLGVVAGRVGWTPDGLLTEWWHDWPADAPDAALAALLGDARTAAPPPWLPAGSVSVGAQVVPLRGIVDYLDGWLAALEEPLGMRADVRGLVFDFLGIDLDAALLGWIGETVQVVDLAPLGTDLRGWVQGTPRVVTVPVLDEGLARDGLPQLGALGLRFLEALAGAAIPVDPFADPFAAGGPSDALDAVLGPDAVAVTRSEVLGVAVDRVRYGATLDAGVAVVDGHLLIVTPYRALPVVLATRAGATDLRADPAWSAALADWPAAHGVSIVDTAAHLAGLADVADLAAQPLAFGAASVLTFGVLGGFDRGWDDDWGSWDGGEAWYLDADGLSYPSYADLPWGLELSALAAQPLAIGEAVTGDLTEDATAALFDLAGVEPGRVVEIEMNDLSGGLDTYLYVLDGDSGEVLFDNDDAPGWDRSYVAFVVQPGVRYQVLATSYGGWGEGAFRLAATWRADAEADVPAEPAPLVEEPDAGFAADAPTYAELLAAADLLPQALDLLAARSGMTVTTTVIDGTSSFSRSLWRLR